MMRWLVRSFLLGALLLVWTASAGAAWLETRVKAHRAVISVDRDGKATVDQELTLGVRGGPLKTFELPGVDADAAIEGEATVVPVVRYGVPAPIPLVVERGDDSTLRIDIEHAKGLRTGTYVFRFRYTTALLARDKIRRRGTAAEVEWVGPRFSDGVDVAKVVFRLPAGPIPPALPTPEDGDEAQLLGSAFLSQLRHDGDQVEVELLRPHIARGEPAVWRLLTSPKIFTGLDRVTPAAARASVVPPVAEPPARRLLGVFVALGLAVGYALLVFLKWSLLRRDCHSLRAVPRALVPLPIAPRAALAGALLAGAGVLGMSGDYPTLGALSLLGAVLLASLGAPRLLLSPRGAGHWLVLKDEDAFARVASPQRGRFLDLGTLPGACLALLSFGAIGAAAVALLGRSPYHALCLALSSIALLPIFATARRSQLPGLRGERARAALPAIARELRERGFKVCAWARLATGDAEPDELRLLVRSARAADGLLALEIGVEEQATIGGFLLIPYVLVRVREGTPAQRCLGRSIVWQRGRGSEERVAIVRPGVPSRALLLELVVQISDQLSGAAPSAARRARNSAGAGSVTSKLGTASPAHAT